MILNALAAFVSLLVTPSTPVTLPSVANGAAGDTLRFAATRSADSTAVAECVQRVVERHGYAPWPAADTTSAKVGEQRWRKRENDGTMTDLHARILVKADSILVPARVTRNDVRATVAVVAVGVLQMSLECRRPRTPAR